MSLKNEERVNTGVDVQIAPTFEGTLAAQRLDLVAKATLRHEGVEGQISLVITDDQSIQALNRDYLGNDAPTDVLAFSAREEAEGFVSAPEAGDYLGDVVISYPRAVAQAQVAGHTEEEEINLLVVHGTLHLLGYDHGDDRERAAMWARQAEILQTIAST